MRIRPCVIIQRDDKILLLHYRYGNSDVYAIPGGSPEKGETLEDTLIREVQEELSINITIDTLFSVGEIIWMNNNESILNCVFTGKNIVGEPLINPHHSTALESAWMPIENIGSMNLYPNIGNEIINAAKNKFSVPPLYIGRIAQKRF